MNEIGKILFFNEKDGKGILITSNRGKVHFSIEEWNDFDLMPSLGLEVVFELKNNMAYSIVPKSSIIQEQNFLTKNIPDTEDTFVDDTNLQENFLIEEEIQSEEEIQQKEQPLNELEEEIEEDYIKVSFDKNGNNARITKEGDDETDGSEEEHFEHEEEINVIEEEVEEVEEELPPKEESITITLNLSTAVNNYFKTVKDHIHRRNIYTKVDGRLNYILAKRFVWTTFNNLTEIDMHIITPKIKSLSSDLKIMDGVYVDFTRKVRYPPIAFEEVFLSCQAEYNIIKEGAQKIIEQLNTLRRNEKIIGGKLRIKKEELNKQIKSQEFDALQHELKSLNGTYVDVVHMMAEFDMRYKHDLKLLHDFEEEFRDDFYKIFSQQAVLYKKDIINILDAQAFLMDSKLWLQAKASKSIKAYFKSSAIEGELNTRTYLKYYLESFDSSTVGGETKELFKLYDYLLSTQKDYILIVSSSPEDAMEYEASLKQIDKSNHVKSFIDEKSAIQWAMQNSVNILVLEDILQRTTAGTFLAAYHKNVLVKPKILLIGNRPKTTSDEYTISKLLSKNVSPRALSQTVMELVKS
jgi:hypothetical protein